MGSITYNPEIKQVLDSFLLSNELVAPGKMFGFPAYYAGKKLFACVYENGVGLKVSAQTLKEQAGKEGVSPFVPMGRHTMKAWIYLTHPSPESFLENQTLLESSAEYVASLQGDSAK
jgi:TfoX/Sxy family transcriptional regulator of competence genes